MVANKENFVIPCYDQSIMNLTLLKMNLHPIHNDDLVKWYPAVTDNKATPSDNKMDYIERIMYGVEEHYIDITELIRNKVINNHDTFNSYMQWKLPSSPKEKDQLFTDPYFWTFKTYLVINWDDK